MKDNAYERIMDSKAGKILAGSLVYGIMFEILLYRNMNGIGIPVLMLTTCLFLIGFFRIFEMRIKQETVFYMAAMVLLGISTVLTTSDFFLGTWCLRLLSVFLQEIWMDSTFRQKNFFCSCLDLYFVLQYCKHLPIMIQICVRRNRRIDLSRCQGLPAYPF